MTVRTPPMLAVRDLRASYGQIEVLHGIEDRKSVV